MHKVLSKVLANKLKVVVQSLILVTQYAFLEDRKVADGILISNKIVDDANRRKREVLIFKVDFEKALL